MTDGGQMVRTVLLLALLIAACSSPALPARAGEVRVAVEKAYTYEEGVRTRVLVGRPGDEPLIDEELGEFESTHAHALMPGTYELRVLEFGCPEEGCAGTTPKWEEWELVCTREFRLRGEESVHLFAQLRLGPQGQECALTAG